MLNGVLKTVSRLSVFAICAAVAACSSSNSSPSLTSPASTSPGSSLISTGNGATIRGTVANNPSAAAQSAPSATGMTVSVSGTNVSASVNSDGTFTLSGVPSGSVELSFSASGTDARGSVGGVGELEQITVTVVISGRTAVVKVEKSELEGRIAGLTPGCPVVTFSIGAVTVTTDATTAFVGGTCSQLVNGVKAEVNGSKQTDGSIQATSVRLEDVAATTPPTSSERELTGAVSGLGGISACPVTAFTVGTTKVVTDATTTFTDGTCPHLANGVKVEVKGSTQADGSVKAAKVSLEDVKETEPAERDGKVSGLLGGASCPITAFTVGTTKVTTDATTVFTGGTCAQLANGVRVEVKGSVQVDGSIRASKVSLEDVNEVEPIEVEGKVSGLLGVTSCPVTSFSIGTLKVTTDGTTQFRKGTCAQLANNLKVEIKGSKQTDGSLKASRVDLDKD